MDQSLTILPPRSAKAQEFGELWREKCTRAPWTFPFKLARTGSLRPARTSKRKATLECHSVKDYRSTYKIITLEKSDRLNYKCLRSLSHFITNKGVMAVYCLKSLGFRQCTRPGLFKFQSISPTRINQSCSLVTEP